jgi:hypothetical protein
MPLIILGVESKPMNSARSKPKLRTIGKVNIAGLKRFAYERLPKHWALRDIILAEKDEIPAIEFVPKCEVWMALLNSEKRAMEY